MKTATNKVIVVFLVLISMNLGYLGIWSNSVVMERLMGLLILSSIFFILSLYRTKTGIIIYIFSFLILIISGPLTSFLIPLLVAVLLSDAIRRDSKLKNSLFYSLVALLVFTTIVKFLAANIPAFWYLLRAISYKITGIVTFGTRLGPSISNILSLFASIVFLCFCILPGKPLKKIIYYLGLVFVVFIVTVNAIACLLVNYTLVALNNLWIISFGQAIVLIAIIIAEKPYEPTNIKNIGRKSFIFPVVLAILFFYIGIMPIINPAKSGHITLVNKGLQVDFETQLQPDSPHGILYNPSFFGQVPHYLDVYGFDYTIVNDLNEINWLTDIIVLVNFNEEFTIDFKEKLKNFVSRGGGLCVFGDHTNVENLMTVTNSLLDWTGFQLVDDSADSLIISKGLLWNNAMDYSYNSLTYKMAHQCESQIMVGASLNMRDYLTTVPLVFGKYGFSDMPDPLNVGQGGRLGNRSFDKDEMAGDLVLVARKTYGKGKVIFFGDTTSIQAPVIATTHIFMEKILWSLTGKSFPGNIHLYLKVLLGVILFAGYLYICRKKMYSQLVFLTFTLGIALIGAGLVNAAIVRNLDNKICERMRSEKVAVVDTATGGLFNLSQSSQDSILGSIYNLMRAGIPAVVSGDWKANLDSKLLFIISPTIKLTPKRAQELKTYVDGGGILIFAAGYEVRDSYKDLLPHFGVKIKPVLLGPVPWKDPSLPRTMALDGPEFKEAWAIEILDKRNVTPYYRFEGYNLVTITEQGKGKFVFIADGRYFLTENIEDIYSGNKENILFLQRLFEEVLENE